MRRDQPSPLRVEQALQLLPDVDALAPLRAILVSSSRARPSFEPHRTVGKRRVHASQVRALLPEAVATVTDHLAVLYEAAVEALEAEQRDDPAGAVRALLRAGEREQHVGRESQARSWYDRALRTAEGLRDRRPEIVTLRHLGTLEASRGHFEDAARFHQRSLALAEAERDHEGAVRACDGLGQIALAHGKWLGAASWFTRGLQYTDNDERLTGSLYLGEGEVGRLRGQVGAAEDSFQRARELFERSGDDEGIVRVLNSFGLLEASRGRHEEALTRFSEALARLRAGGRAPALEMDIRLNVCRLYLAWGRLPDAEDEIRRAEETAVVRNFPHKLARVYLLLGELRGRQRDDGGFVFFEKAIELCRGREPTPRLEAEVYIAYARFKSEMGDHDESRAYLERAVEIIETIGNGPLFAEIQVELEKVKAS